MYDVGTTFEWDDIKSLNNLKKHNVSFDEAMTVFYDEFAKVMDDISHSTRENRFILIGHSQKNRLLLISHLYKEKYEVIRIISAREATKREKNDFQNLKS